MQPEPHPPQVVKVTDTPGLLALEDKAAALDLSQRLRAEWLAENTCAISVGGPGCPSGQLVQSRCLPGPGAGQLGLL
jgi:hypothetical protein